MNLGAVLTGAVQGGLSGVNEGLDISNKVYEARRQQAAQLAAQNLHDAFEHAAQNGGFSNQNQSWFDSVAADVASTGDFQGATAFSQLGTQVAANSAKLSAQRAALSMASGNHDAAIADLNTALSRMGAKGTLTGVTTGPDGTPHYTTSDGKSIPVSQAQDLANRLMLAPDAYLKNAIEQAKANSQIGLQGAQTEAAQAQAQKTTATTAPEVSMLNAKAGEAQTGSALHQAQKSAIEQKLPGEIAHTQAETEQAQSVSAFRQAQAEDIGAQSPYKIGKLKADATKAEADAQLAQAKNDLGVVNTDPRSGMTLKALDDSNKDWDKRFNPDGSGGGAPPSAQADPSSPTLRDTTRQVALKLMTDKKMSAGTAAQMAQQHVKNTTAKLVEANPELSAHPDLAAEITSVFLAYPELETQSDQQGTYVVIPLDGDEAHKVYVQRSNPAATVH